jgi:hypothetical protein
MRWSVKTKLVAMSLLLVVVPVAVISGICLFQFNGFVKDTVKNNFDSRFAEWRKSAAAGLEADSSAIKNILERAENDLLSVAGSSAVKSYFECGDSVLDSAGRKEIEQLVRLTAMNIKAQTEAIQKKLLSDASLAREVLENLGPVKFESRTAVDWEAKNQMTQQVSKISLPLMLAGNTALSPNKSFGEMSPVVDKVKKASGSFCTIFQRMNPAGDMLRIVTNVPGSDGSRAVGTYIPAKNSDGSENQIIKEVLSGKIYTGRAFVVNDWCASAYEPVRDTDGQVTGMLFTGVKELEDETLSKSLLGLRIGEKGYFFIMDPSGKLLLHPRKELVGKNVLTDLKISDLKQALEDRADDRINAMIYNFEGKDKFVVYTGFKQWNWIICGSGYCEEMNKEAASCLALMQNAVKSLGDSAVKVIGGKQERFYNQLRVFNSKGMEVVKYQEGVISKDLRSKADKDWFREAMALKKGAFSFTRIELAENTGTPELRVSAPIFINDKPVGAAVINLNWDAVSDLMKQHVYGKTGYPYIINEKGILVTHPKYTLKDNVSLTAQKYGQLAHVVTGKMLAGEAGDTEYNFEGIQKVVVFAPLLIGDKKYTIAAAYPLSDLDGETNLIKSEAAKQSSSIIKVVMLSGLSMTVLGALTGLMFSARMANKLKKVIKNLSGTSEHLASSSNQQASSLEEIAASLSQVSAMTARNAQDSAESSREMSTAREKSADVKALMEKLTKAFERISQSSAETGKIIKTIDEIAFQTNLLALNAAVEAARAGEAGRSFAVVADEVRSLAVRAATAAKNTGELIDGTVRAVSEGSDITSGTKKAIEENYSAIEKVSEMIMKIDGASQEQAVGIKQLDTAVAQLSSLTQSNAACADDARNQASLLGKIIGGSKELSIDEQLPLPPPGPHSHHPQLSARLKQQFLDD